MTLCICRKLIHIIELLFHIQIINEAVLVIKKFIFMITKEVVFPLLFILE